MKNLAETRKSLGLTLAAAGNAVGVTREAVRLAERGDAPDAAKKLATYYKGVIGRRVKRLSDFDVIFKFERQKDGVAVLRSYSKKPFEITDALIGALLDGFERGTASESTIIFEV
jgi:transcriptional regulator with XRE-family HTH domain